MDPLDTFVKGCSQPFLRGFLFFAAVWLGSIAAGIAIGMGYALLDPVNNWAAIPKYILIAPGLLLSVYALWNFPFFIVTLAVFIKTDRELWWLWAAVAFAQSIFAMLGYANRVAASLWITSGIWFIWVVNIATVIAAAFFVRQWQLNRWAAQMAQLKAENAQRRADLAKRGIATFDTVDFD